MRVGTITFHQALNYGAVLQAYALQKAIEGLGHDCEVVDYRCDRLSRAYAVLPTLRGGPRGFVSGLVHTPGKLAKHLRFNRFRSRYLRTSSVRYDRTSIGAAEADYDCFVVGSDQVWNPTLTDTDDTYFLAFCEDPQKKVSYAASLGRSERLSEYSDLYRRNLASFRALSVRESDSSQYLSRLLEREVLWVLDPVFLIPASEWAALSRKPKTAVPYIFAYCLHETALYRYAERISKMTGYPVVYVPQGLRARFAGQRVRNLAVEEFLGYIKGAEFVVTDSFHAMAFALVFQKDFQVQLKGRFPELNARMTSLLEAVGLEGQVVGVEDVLRDDIPRVDYHAVSMRLQSLIESSVEYLQITLDHRRRT